MSYTRISWVTAFTTARRGLCERERTSVRHHGVVEYPGSNTGCEVQFENADQVEGVHVEYLDRLVFAHRRYVQTIEGGDERG